nr:D-alanyl-D-alanine carboxypeptidase family protein [Tissierella sp.]
MNNIILEQKDIYNGTLILVNNEYALNDQYFIGKLIPLNINRKEVLLEYKSAIILNHLLMEVDALEKIVTVSGFRNKLEQMEIYNNSIIENGQEFTERYVAKAGHSEHHTGLSIDLGKNSKDINSLCPEFPYVGICEDFRKLSFKYGFIQRYKSGKEDITGIAEEPWHFRYVGFPHSQIMEEKELSLEEYIENIRGYNQDNPLIFESDRKRTKIFFIKAIDDKDLVLKFKGRETYQISGNNIDGFIVTLSDNYE